MPPASTDGSRWPRVLGALACFAIALNGAGPRLGLYASFLQGWSYTLAFLLVMLGFAAAGRVTQRAAAWVAFAALTASIAGSFVARLAPVWLDGDRLPDWRLMRFNFEALTFVQDAAVLVWALGLSRRARSVVAPALAVLAFLGLAVQVGSWIGDVPIEVFLVFSLEWAAVGTLLLRLPAFRAPEPRSHAGMPTDLPRLFMLGWVVLLVGGFLVARVSLARLRAADEAVLGMSVVTAGGVIALECLLTAVVLWIARVTGPGPVGEAAADPE